MDGLALGLIGTGIEPPTFWWVDDLLCPRHFTYFNFRFQHLYVTSLTSIFTTPLYLFPIHYEVQYIGSRDESHNGTRRTPSFRCDSVLHVQYLSEKYQCKNETRCTHDDGKVQDFTAAYWLEVGMWTWRKPRGEHSFAVYTSHLPKMVSYICGTNNIILIKKLDMDYFLYC